MKPIKWSKYSKSRLMQSFAHQNVPKEWADNLSGYLLEGFPPGSFFTHLLANDALGMIGTSHTNNTIPALKTVANWLNSQMYPGTFHGSRKAVELWLAKTPKERREALEKMRLVYTEEEEIVMILKDEPALEPAFRP
jgi:hypothetical protein